MSQRKPAAVTRLHPGSKLDEKTKLIDKLLSEGGLTIPATLLMPKKQED